MERWERFSPEDTVLHANNTSVTRRVLLLRHLTLRAPRLHLAVQALRPSVLLTVALVYRCHMSKQSADAFMPARPRQILHVCLAQHGSHTVAPNTEHSQTAPKPALRWNRPGGPEPLG